MTLADSYAIVAFLVTVDRLGLMSMEKYCATQGFDIVGLGEAVDENIDRAMINELWNKVEEYSDES